MSRRTGLSGKPLEAMPADALDNRAEATKTCVCEGGPVRVTDDEGVRRCHRCGHVLSRADVREAVMVAALQKVGAKLDELDRKFDRVDKLDRKLDRVLAELGANDPEQRARLATAIERLAGELEPTGNGDGNGNELLTAEQVAARLGMARETVYNRSREFGARRVGSGPKPRLRFVWAEVERAVAADEAKAAKTEPKPTKKRKLRNGPGPELLPIKGGKSSS